MSQPFLVALTDSGGRARMLQDRTPRRCGAAGVLPPRKATLALSPIAF